MYFASMYTYALSLGFLDVAHGSYKNVYNSIAERAKKEFYNNNITTLHPFCSCYRRT